MRVCDQIEQSLDEAVDQVIFKYGDHSTTMDALIDNVQHYVSLLAGSIPSVVFLITKKWQLTDVL